MTEGIRTEAVTAWLAEHLPRIKAPVRYALITGGHSNLTYQCVDTEGKRYVLRRPPLNHLLESAHDMGREHQIIDALQHSKVPVPACYGLCTSPSVNDADFYVMAFVDGLVLHDSVIADTLSLEHRHALSVHLVHILSELHLIDPEDVGLGKLGRKEGYLSRQLKRWAGQWEATKTDPIPAMEDSCRILKERMPEQHGATIVHGDYRLGNMIVAEGEVKALLDWELCTLGDPLADLGYLLNNWVSPGELEGEEGLPPTAAGGFIQRDEICATYADNTGRDLSEIDYYRAFSHWRLAAISQGVYKRYLVGAMGDDQEIDLEQYKESVTQRATAAMELLSTTL